MGSVPLETNQTWFRPSFPREVSPPRPTPEPTPAVSPGGGLDSKISPTILLIIVMLAVVFFVSGLLHLLVRYLLRPTNREPEDPDNVTALQGQLQQLFHLHDAGVDQSFIDTLPVFLYRAIIGVKDPFDCAVCLCEFEADDKLRLLPRCSHAFHIECIDTWLLSHSTCPLCRSSLLVDFPAAHVCSPVVLVLESGRESSREMVADREPSGAIAQFVPHVEEDIRPLTNDVPQKTRESGVKETEATASETPQPARVVPVKLGKFRNVDAGVVGVGEESSNCDRKIDERRCFSMGSFEYVMDESSLLQVAIKQPAKKPIVKKPGHRPAMSECGCNSSREVFKDFKVLETSRSTTELRGENGGGGTSRISSDSQQRESFSISKIWLRSRRERAAGEERPRRVLSFRLPLQVKCGSSRRTATSELDVACWDKSESELGFDVEGGSCGNSVVSRAEETPSFARRTLLWIVGGRHPKVVNHV